MDSEKNIIIQKQFKQAKGDNPKITCACGFTVPVRFSYRCYYCDQFFCYECAKLHFGKSREQYKKEKIMEYELLAKKITEALEHKKAFKDNLPMHLDRDKFLNCVKDDIDEVLEKELKKKESKKN